MKHIAASSLLCSLLLTASFCYGDKLVITYRSGATQTIQLDQPSQEVGSWQYLPEPVPAGHSVTTPPPAPPEPAAAPAGQQPEQSSDVKSSVRIKLNAKPIRD